MLEKIIMKHKKEGTLGVVLAILKRMFCIKAKTHPLIRQTVSVGKGLEIGGPSSIFQQKNIIPVYGYVQSLDNCNFANHTVWEGSISEDLKYFYNKSHAPGRQYILEATALNQIQSNTYDFLLSSHMIEHTANPIKALKEWTRVVKEGGHLIVVIPHKDGTFDHRRPVTTLDHLIRDHENNTTEKDLTHMDEILALHDLGMDLEAGTHQQFTERSEKNYENRCFHHHVFNTHLAVSLFGYLKLDIKAVEVISPMHILIVAQKNQHFDAQSSADFINYVSTEKFKSPFASDRP